MDQSTIAKQDPSEENLEQFYSVNPENNELIKAAIQQSLQVENPNSTKEQEDLEQALLLSKQSYEEYLQKLQEEEEMLSRAINISLQELKNLANSSNQEQLQNLLNQ